VAVSFEHESLLELFRQRETFAVELLTESLGVEVPPWSQVVVSEGDLGQVDPVETRADLVLLLDEGGRPVFGIVVEVQLARAAEKRLRWPLYATTLRARHGCPVTVLVVTPSASVAEWARAPISLGPGNRYAVTVLGPDSVPRIESADVPPELALLSAKAHAESEGGLAVVEAALQCVQRLDGPARSDYHDRLFAWLSPSIREQVKAMLEEHFPYPQSDFAKEHYGRGAVQGQAKVVLLLIKLRFGPPSPEVEARVRAAGEAELELWAARILTAEALDQVFAPA
jgi:hypothetical protein